MANRLPFEEICHPPSMRPQRRPPPWRVQMTHRRRRGYSGISTASYSNLRQDGAHLASLKAVWTSDTGLIYPMDATSAVPVTLTGTDETWRGYSGVSPASYTSIRTRRSPPRHPSKLYGPWTRCCGPRQTGQARRTAVYSSSAVSAPCLHWVPYPRLPRSAQPIATVIRHSALTHIQGDSATHVRSVATAPVAVVWPLECAFDCGSQQDRALLFRSMSTHVSCCWREPIDLKAHMPSSNAR